MRITRPRTSGNRKQSGFTLIEVVVALGLLGLILAVLAGSLHFSTAVWEVSQQKDQDIQTLQVTRRVVMTLLGSALPFPRRDGDIAAGVEFVGEESALSFVGYSPVDLGGGPPHWLKFEVDPSADGGTLFLRWRPFTADTGSAGDAYQEAAFLKGVKGMKIRYFGADELGDLKAWHQSWRTQKRLPELIEIVVSGTDESEVPWPALVVAPRVTVVPTQRLR